MGYKSQLTSQVEQNPRRSGTMIEMDKYTTKLGSRTTSQIRTTQGPLNQYQPQVPFNKNKKQPMKNRQMTTTMGRSPCDIKESGRSSANQLMESDGKYMSDI